MGTFARNGLYLSAVFKDRYQIWSDLVTLGFVMIFA